MERLIDRRVFEQIWRYSEWASRSRSQIYAQNRNGILPDDELLNAERQLPETGMKIQSCKGH